MLTTLNKTKHPKNVNTVITYTNQKYPNQPLFQLYIVNYRDVLKKKGEINLLFAFLEDPLW